MRRLLCGAVFVCGCFNPGGGDGASGASTGGPATDGSGPVTQPSDTAGSEPGSGSEPTSETGGPRPTSETGGTVSTTDPPGETTETTVPATTTTTHGPETGTDECQEDCGPCGVCEAGRCEAAGVDTPCNPPVNDCDGLVWGEVNAVCFTAMQGQAKCTANGECVVACDQKGPVLAKCTDEECLKDGHPCTPGAPAETVTPASLCHDTNMPAPNCAQVCQAGKIREAVCTVGGDCVPGAMVIQDCAPYACTMDTLMCKQECDSFDDCAPMNYCDPMLSLCLPL